MTMNEDNRALEPDLGMGFIKTGVEELFKERFWSNTLKRSLMISI
jgi:hypothetical protein